ncbi:hypothetical protein SAMN06265346_12012 [Flavobacterium hercynium]|nr:hypothetical protein SAMN06265346_12012 [Flavobacterium hercynium]
MRQLFLKKYSIWCNIYTFAASIGRELVVGGHNIVNSLRKS